MTLATQTSTYPSDSSGRLTGRVVLLTGAAGGVGRATAKLLAAWRTAVTRVGVDRSMVVLGLTRFL